MKKNYSFLILLTLSGFLGISQNAVLDAELHPLPKVRQSGIDHGYIKSSLKQSKTTGDTLFYEDFDGGLNGWTAINNRAGNNIWEWNTVFRAGQFTSNISAIQSTTTGNGFMSLPADFYNTPIPAGGPEPMDTYFESPDITIPSSVNSVFVTYQQYLRYCCSGANKLVLQISTDGFITTTEFDATNDLAVNAPNTSNAVGGAVNAINISCALQGDTTFRMRFYSEGNTYYFWMIDDIAVIEGIHNDLELQRPYMEFNNSNYTYNPFYGQIPYDVFPPLPFSGEIKNNGDYTSTNTAMNISVDHLSYPTGGPGNGNLHTASKLIPNSGTLTGAYTLDCDSTTPVITDANPFIPLIMGDFQVSWFASSDSVDQNMGNETASQFFSITDSVYARDDNSFGEGVGPRSFRTRATPSSVGDRLATLYVIEKNARTTKFRTRPTSITYRVSGDPLNIGVEITPKIWLFNEDSLFINGGSFSVDRAMGPEVAGSFFPYTVTASDTGTFLTLPINRGSAFINGFDSASYAVGWEVTNPNNGKLFEVLNDESSAAMQAPVTSFLFFGDIPSSGWGWIRANPGVRLNMGDIPPIGIHKVTPTTAQFSIVPNPNNGNFKLNISSATSSTYNLSVKNILGQSIYSEFIKVNGQMTKQLNLTSFEKGVYFISLENETENITKKIVLQ